MYETLKYLTQINPPRNYKNIDSLNQVADYIKNCFEVIGLEVSFQEFEVNGKLYKNVIATLNSQYDKRLIIGGHYDVCGDIQGADDNASAVAGIIESSRQLYEYKDKLNFRIDFVAYTLEEPPFFGTENMGSYQHAKYLKDNNIGVIGMINYEMIGYFTDEPDTQEYPLEAMKLMYPTIGNFIAIASNENSASFLKELDFDDIDKEIDSHNIILPDLLSYITASDHINYWKLGFKAVMVTDTAHFRNKNYHTVGDTIETIDFKKMQHSVDMVVNSVVNLNTKAHILLNKIEIDSILKLCAIKWIEYCGISISSRTIYWDMAIKICGDSDVFEKYIVSYEYGEESLSYDTSFEYGIEFYENIKEYEFTQLTDEEKNIFIKGYNILIAHFKS